jgi:hypothetical protein
MRRAAGKSAPRYVEIRRLESRLSRVALDICICMRRGALSRVCVAQRSVELRAW